MNETIIKAWRAAFADAVTLGARQPADLAPLPPSEDYAEAKITIHRLADNLEHDQAPLPPAAREALWLAVGARFEDAVCALRERWG